HPTPDGGGTAEMRPGIPGRRPAGRGGAPVSSCANSSGGPTGGHTTRAQHSTATVSDMRNPLVTRMTGFGSTVFAEMTQKALQFDAVNLGQGFPDTDGPAELLQIAQEAIASGLNQYSPAIGMQTLREAVAEHQERFYGLRVDPAQEVLVTVGATEAIAASVLALVEPGDEVVTFEPYYDSYAASIALAGGVRRTVPLRFPDLAIDA